MKVTKAQLLAENARLQAQLAAPPDPKLELLQARTARIQAVTELVRRMAWLVDRAESERRGGW